MGKPKITLFVDCVSPFAYIGYYALRHFPIFQQCDLEYVPIFLGGLMRNCGNTAPIFIKNKDKWIGVERERWARLLNIPMKEGTPEGFPPNTISAMRALTSIQTTNPSKLPAAIDALFEALWVRHDKIADKGVVLSTLSKAIGEADAKTAMEGANGPDAKKKLGDNTDAAFAAGAFGLPWFWCTNEKGLQEGFWGVDHMGQMLDFLQLERPKSGEWRAHL